MTYISRNLLVKQAEELKRSNYFDALRVFAFAAFLGITPCSLILFSPPNKIPIYIFTAFKKNAFAPQGLGNQTLF